MKTAVASEVVVTQHGLVVIGTKGPGTRLWFLPKNRTRASERLHELTMPFEPPRGLPAALLPSGKLLVVGKNGQSLTVEADRSPQPGPVLSNLVIDGLSPDGVAFAEGPQFLRYRDGVWIPEGSVETPRRAVNQIAGAIAIGAEGAAWLAPTWKPLTLKTKAALHCTDGSWIGGDGVVLERTGKTFKAHRVKGSVTAITAWGKSALMLVDGALVDLKGTRLKAPPELTSISAHDGVLWGVSRGGLFETDDLRRWSRKALPK